MTVGITMSEAITALVAEKRAVVRLAGMVSYLDLRGMLVRRGI